MNGVAKRSIQGQSYYVELYSLLWEDFNIALCQWISYCTRVEFFELKSYYGFHKWESFLYQMVESGVRLGSIKSSWENVLVSWTSIPKTARVPNPSPRIPSFQIRYVFGLKWYASVMGDFLCHADIGKYLIITKTSARIEKGHHSGPQLKCVLLTHFKLFSNRRKRQILIPG